MSHVEEILAAIDETGEKYRAAAVRSTELSLLALALHVRTLSPSAEVFNLEESDQGHFLAFVNNLAGVEFDPEGDEGIGDMLASNLATTGPGHETWFPYAVVPPATRHYQFHVDEVLGALAHLPGEPS